MGESEEVEEALVVLRAECRTRGGRDLELLRGLGGGEGEVEVGAEAEHFAQLGQSAQERGAAEPAAQDGGGRPVLGWGAGRVVSKGPEKNSLRVGGAGNAG